MNLRIRIIHIVEAKIKQKQLKVPVNPKRVAVLDYGALDIMQQMGLQDKIVSIAKGQGASFCLLPFGI